MGGSPKSKYNTYEEYVEKGFLNYSSGALDANIYSLGKEPGWSLSEVKKVWDSHLSIGKEIGNLYFYTHIPFCMKKCHYCENFSRKLESEKKLEEYVDKLIKYIKFFEPAFEEGVFDAFYMGGGSPSILTKRQLDRFLSTVFSCFDFKKGSEKTVENDPRTVTAEKLDILEKYGINRVSFGIQSFDEEVLKKNNRLGQTEEKVRKAVNLANNRDFELVNVDLMIGLLGDSKNTILNSFKKALSLNPDELSFYSTRPTERYISILDMSRKDFLDRRMNLIEKVFDDLLEIAEDFGYEIPLKRKQSPGSFGFRKRDVESDLIRRYRKDSLFNLDSLLGLGKSSQSKIFGRLHYEMEEDLKEDPEDYKVKGVRFNIKREKLEKLTKQLAALEKVPVDHFESKFKCSFKEDFGEAIKDLKNLDAVFFDGDELYLKSDNPKDRLIYTLFFFPEKDIEKYVQKMKEKRET